MTDDETIQTNCKNFREEAGLSQQDVAEAVSKSVDAVRNWEQHRRTPERESLMALARLYGRPVEDFYNPTPPIKVTKRPEWEVRLKVVGAPPQGYLDELEALKRKWSPEKLDAHATARRESRRGKKK